MQSAGDRREDIFLSVDHRRDWPIPENAGPMFFYYNGVSAGKIIPKYKIRLIKMKYIDPEGPSAMTGLLIRRSGRRTAGLMWGNL